MPRKTLIYNLEDIPSFESDAAASAFWDTHSYSAALLAATPDSQDSELNAILARRKKMEVSPLNKIIIRRTRGSILAATRGLKTV